MSKETKSSGTIKIGRGHLVRYVTDDRLVKRQSQSRSIFPMYKNIFNLDSRKENSPVQKALSVDSFQRL